MVEPNLMVEPNQMVEPNHVRSICKIDCSTRWNKLTISKENKRKTEKRKQFAVLVCIARNIVRAPLLDLERKQSVRREVSNTIIIDSLGIWYKYSECIVLCVETYETR